MKNRREFIQYTGATLAAISTPLPLISQAMQETRLPTRPIPATGEPLPIIGLGNSEAFQSGDLELSRQLLEIFMGKGGAYVDTSGPGRFTVGKIVREKKAQDEMFLGTYISSTDAEEGIGEIKKVQEAQDVTALDLILTRNVNDMASNPDKFRSWKEDGLTRHLGVARPNSSFYEAMMKFMESGVVDFVQVNYSMLETAAEQRLLPMAQDKGIAVIINRPFINGQYFSIVRGHELPEWAAEFDCHSWAQFSLKFILAHPAVNCVLTETSNPKHAIDNLDAGFGQLPDEKTRQRMLEVMRGLASQS
jgi:diketogulonate reductase-like aldo/keto reductase